jgi:aerobic carbon-monoxide dehydrogenase medium subunit
LPLSPKHPREAVVKPAPFSYRAPASLDEAVEALSEGPMPRVLAGGQSLVPMLNLRLAPVDAVVDITRIPELRETREAPASILYGAAITHAAFEDRLVPDGSNGLVPFVAARIAYRAVRCRGTIGGALALADPAADWVTTVIALEGTLHLVSKAGRRAVAAEEFVLGPYFTALDEGELIEAVEIPKRASTERWGHHKVAVKVGEYADSLAIALIDRSRPFARVVLGAVDGVPIVLRETALAVLENRSGDDLAAAVRSELIAAERDFSPAKLILHSTTILRAIKDAATK